MYSKGGNVSAWQNETGEGEMAKEMSFWSLDGFFKLDNSGMSEFKL